MLKIIHHKVAFIAESIEDSGLPFSQTPTENSERMRKLGKAKIGSGHDTALKGISTYLKIQAPMKFFNQFERYSFQDTVSSTSTMHTINKIGIRKLLPPTINEDHINWLESQIKAYNTLIDNKSHVEAREQFQKISDNIPSGYLYTRGIITNYLQLKTMYHQRKNHKLDEWKTFCKWMIDTLPRFAEFIGVEKDSNVDED